MGRRSLMWLLLALLGLGLLTPVSGKAEVPPTPVLLIHGHGGTSDLTWRTATAYLESRGYQEGRSLFTVDLPEGNSWKRMGLLEDAAFVLDRVHGILEKTGATQVDLVGHSRGGLVARLLATGGTGYLVRRVVTMNTPHQGAMSELELLAMLEAAGIANKRLPAVHVPADLRTGSEALATIQAREARYADHQAHALVVGSTWKPGVPPVLTGHDGAVSLRSQLGWLGVTSRSFRLGPTAHEISTMLRSELAAGLLVWRSPHLQSHESEQVLQTVADFLLVSDARAPLRPCNPNCQDWRDLAGQAAEAEIRPWLGELVPYAVAPNGQRLFEPDRPMTRAEFLWGIVRGLGLQERLRRPSFRDTAGHWALGWVETALDAKLLEPGAVFLPDEPITRAEAAMLVARARSLPDGPTPGRHTDAHGHRWEAQIEAVLSLGLMPPAQGGFRPDEPLTMAEGALLLVRSFGR